MSKTAAILLTFFLGGLGVHRFLAGKIDESTKFGEGDIRNILPRFTEEARVANKALLDLLQQFAEKRNATPAQMALAWVLRHPQVTSALIGASRITQLEENVAALNRLDFTPEELAEIDRWAGEANLNIWSASSMAG